MRNVGQRSNTGILVAAALLLAACAQGKPQTTVEDLSWVCGERRCSVTFMLTNESNDDEALAVRVRAYAGESVQNRREVGEHTERLVLASRGAKRYTVSVDTSEQAQRARVLLEFDER